MVSRLLFMKKNIYTHFFYNTGLFSLSIFMVNCNILWFFKIICGLLIKVYTMIFPFLIKKLLNHHEYSSYNVVSNWVSVMVFQHQSLHQRPLGSTAVSSFPPIPSLLYGWHSILTLSFPLSPPDHFPLPM